MGWGEWEGPGKGQWEAYSLKKILQIRVLFKRVFLIFPIFFECSSIQFGSAPVLKWNHPLRALFCVGTTLPGLGASCKLVSSPVNF